MKSASIVVLGSAVPLPFCIYDIKLFNVKKILDKQYAFPSPAVISAPVVGVRAVGESCIEPEFDVDSVLNKLLFGFHALHLLLAFQLPILVAPL
jgi:hypothetical protein